MVADDGVPVEFVRAAGLPYLRQLARLAAKGLATRMPMAWRTGIMVPVPRKAKMPISFVSSRGVLAGSHPG
eukprot:9549768-Lingulodinium_polyedra.AAC.1